MNLRRLGMAVLAVMALAGVGLSGWLYTEQAELRSQVAATHDEMADLRAQVRLEQLDFAEAVGRAVEPRLAGLERNLKDLTEALFGFQGPPIVEFDTINELRDRLFAVESEVESLRFCVNRLVNDLSFGSGFLLRC